MAEGLELVVAPPFALGVTSPVGGGGAVHQACFWGTYHLWVLTLELCPK